MTERGAANEIADRQKRNNLNNLYGLMWVAGGGAIFWHSVVHSLDAAGVFLGGGAVVIGVDIILGRHRGTDRVDLTNLE